MAFSKQSCRLCLSESEFNVSLFGNYSRNNNIEEKILMCLKVLVEDTDPLMTICYRCVGNVESYYDFKTMIKKSQNRFNYSKDNERHLAVLKQSFSRPHAPCTSSIRERPEEKKEKSSSFLYVPPKPIVKEDTNVWKTALQASENRKFDRDDGHSKKKVQEQGKCSPDFFESDSQEEEQKDVNFKLTPDGDRLKILKKNSKFSGWPKSKK